VQVRDAVAPAGMDGASRIQSHDLSLATSALTTAKESAEVQRGAQTDRVATFTMHPSLSYPLGDFETAQEDARDEGEARLATVRAVLYACERQDEKLLLPQDAHSILAALLPRGTCIARQKALDSLMKPCSQHKPALRLAAPQGQIISASTADGLDASRRLRNCIGLQGVQDKLYLKGISERCRPAPRVRVECNRFHCGGDVEAHTHATLTLKQMRDRVTNHLEPDAIQIEIVPAFGVSQPKIWTFRGLDKRYVSRLFHLPARHMHAFKLLPEKALGGIPACIGKHIADYFQKHLRMHVVTAALSPEHTVRPLMFSKITCRREKAHDGRPGYVIRAILHKASVCCLCPLHEKHRVEERAENAGQRFVDSHAEFTIAMCCQPLAFFRGDRPGECPEHREQTPAVCQVASHCCHSTSVSMVCKHRTADSARAHRIGLASYNVPLDKPNLLHARALVAAAFRCVAPTSTTMALVAKRADLGTLEAHTLRIERELEQRLGAVARMRAERPESQVLDAEALERNDDLAIRLLKKGGVRQHVQSPGNPVLARTDENGDRVCLSGNEATLKQSHLHLFAPPPSRATGRKRSR